MKQIKTADKTWQQGDVFGVKLDMMPEGERKVVGRTRVVLAHGENGHSHVVEDEDAELIQIGERILLNLAKAATVVHEEHGAIQLSPGIWEIGRVKEYDPFSDMTRRVID